MWYWESRVSTSVKHRDVGTWLKQIAVYGGKAFFTRNFSMVNFCKFAVCDFLRLFKVCRLPISSNLLFMRFNTMQYSMTFLSFRGLAGISMTFGALPRWNVLVCLFVWAFSFQVRPSQPRSLFVCLFIYLFKSILLSGVSAWCNPLSRGALSRMEKLWPPPLSVAHL